MPSGLKSTFTMKKYLLFIIFLLAFFACNNKSKIETKIDETPISLQVERFDKLFYETDPKDLANLKSKFPYLFPNAVADSVWVNKMNNPQWRELYGEVQKKYTDFSTIQTGVENSIKISNSSKKAFHCHLG